MSIKLGRAWLTIVETMKLILSLLVLKKTQVDIFFSTSIENGCIDICINISETNVYQVPETLLFRIFISILITQKKYSDLIGACPLKCIYYTL